MKENDELNSSKKHAEPILVKQISTESKTWGFIKRLGSVLAIILTAIVIISTIFPNMFTKIKVESKIISLNMRSIYGNYTPIIGDSGKISGIYFFLRVGTNIIGSDLSFKDLNLYVHYPNNEIYKCTPIGLFDWVNRWWLDDNCYYADIPKNEILFYQSVLEAG